MKAILNNIFSYQQFSEEYAWKKRKLPPNTVVVKKGEQARTFFYVEKGKLRVSGIVALDNDKQVQPGVCDLEQGAVFGELCLHFPHIRNATVTTLDDVDLLEIDGEILSIFLDDHPVLGYLFYKELFKITAERLSLANDRVENLMAWGLKVHDFERVL